MPSSTKEFDPLAHGAKPIVDDFDPLAHGAVPVGNSVSDNRPTFSGSNLFLKGLDALNTPQQMIFGGIKGAIEGKPVLQSAKEGAFANTSFRDVLQSAGMPKGKSLNEMLPSAGGIPFIGNITAQDVAGFAGDVVLDPTNLIPVGALTKGFKKAADISGATALAAKAIPRISSSEKAVKAIISAEEDVLRARKYRAIEKGQQLKTKIQKIGKEYKIAPEEVGRRVSAEVEKRTDTTIMRGLRKDGIDDFNAAQNLAEDVDTIKGANVNTATVELPPIVEEATRIKVNLMKNLIEEKKAGLGTIDLDDASLDYMTHLVTKDTKEKLVKSKEMRSLGLRYSARHAFQLQRKYRGMSIDTINDLASKGELPGYEGVIFPKFFEDNPALVQTVRLIRGEKAMSDARIYTQAAETLGKSLNDPEIAAMLKEDPMRFVKLKIANVPDPQQPKLPRDAQHPQQSKLPREVQRIEEVGAPESSVEKPQGLYTSPADVPSPHSDLGGKRRTYIVNQQAKVLYVDGSDAFRLPRHGKGPVIGQSAGIASLRKFVGDEEAKRLVFMPRKALAAELKQKYPSIDWDRYYDTTEMAEAYSAQLARAKGYDAIYSIDPDPQWSEYVGLTSNAFKQPHVANLAGKMSGYVFEPEVAKHLDAYYDAAIAAREPSSFLGDAGKMVRGAATGDIKEFGTNFLSVYDQIQNEWKKLTLFIFPAYHARNAVGNVWNNGLAGIWNPAEYKKAWNFLHAEPDKAFTLGGKQYIKGELDEMLADYGIRGQFAHYMDLPADLSSVKSKRLNPIAFGMKVGNAIEDNSRLAHFFAQLDRGMKPHEAALSVKKYLFDYGDLSPFEKGVMRRIMPFYAWTRNNIPLQLRSVLDKPKQFNILGDVIASMEKDKTKPADTDKLMARWMKENTVIQVRNDSDGNPEFFLLGGWLPAADLAKMSKPLDAAIEMAGPMVKAPIELIGNRSIYFGNDIERFPGEKEKFLGMPMRKQLSNLFRNVRILTEFDRALAAGGKFFGKEITTRAGEDIIPFFTRSLFGGKTYAVDIRRERQNQAWQRRDLIRQRAREIRKGRPYNVDVLEELIQEKQ